MILMVAMIAVDGRRPLDHEVHDGPTRFSGEPGGAHARARIGAGDRSRTADPERGQR